MNSSGTSQSGQISRRTRGLRRGREADELFQIHVPVGYKREMVPGYVPVDEVCHYNPISLIISNLSGQQYGILFC